MRFLLIDRITDLESGSRATGLKNVTLSEDFCIAFPSRIEMVKFHHLVRPGDQLLLDVQITGRENDLFQIRGEARCQDHVAASARLEMRTQPAAAFQSPEDARALYRMIRGTSGL